MLPVPYSAFTLVRKSCNVTSEKQLKRRIVVYGPRKQHICWELAISCYQVYCGPGIQAEGWEVRNILASSLPWWADKWLLGCRCMLCEIHRFFKFLTVSCVDSYLRDEVKTLNLFNKKRLLYIIIHLLNLD